MWFVWIFVGIIMVLSCSAYLVIYKIEEKKGVPSDISYGMSLVAVIFLIINIFVIVFSCWKGFNNYATIPAIRQYIRLERVNEVHYRQAMKYNFGDESNERKTSSHVRWFKDGDFSESKDNKTWKQNYHDWYYNKELIVYHKYQLKYYQHPLRNWRYGESLLSLDPNK